MRQLLTNDEQTQAMSCELIPPVSGDTWLGLTFGNLPAAQASAWAALPSCGAVVLFSGIARDHSNGRPNVDMLEYEAYEMQVVPCFRRIADEMRHRCSELGRIALLHRLGRIAIGEVAVVTAVSAPHREEAFSAAKFCIDAVKSTAPIWKRERWQGGEGWAASPEPVNDISSLAS